jgi:putative ABC transport system permease protein
MLRELTLALRLAARRPLLSGAIIATLTLGIGSTTALVAVVRAAILRAAPFPDADRLVVMWLRDQARDQPFVEVSYPDFLDWRRDGAHLFEGLAAMPPVNFPATLSTAAEPRQIHGRAVSASFFDLLDVPPALGRTFMDAEDRPGGGKVIVISHALWRDLLGSDAAVVGKPLTLNGEPRTILGVMPPRFAYPAGAQFWMPIEPAVPTAAIQERNVNWLLVVGRRREGVAPEAARAAMDGIVRRLDRQYFNKEDRRIVIEPLVDQIVGGIRRPLLALLAAVVLLLLIGLANVGGLLLTRATERRREMAVRTALGASRWRLARQTLVEALPLALAGAAAGLLLSGWIVTFLASGRGLELPPGVSVTVDRYALAVAVGLAIASAALCAVAPALEAAGFRRRSLADRLRDTAGGLRHDGAQSGLAVAEIALAVVLVAGALLLFRSFTTLARSDFGFDASRLLALEVPLPDDGPRQVRLERAREFYAAALERIRALPGVRAAAGVFLRPLWSTIGFDGIFTAEGQTEAEAQNNPHLNVEGVTPGYFATMGTRLLRGRDFTESDDERVDGRIIVSESMARRTWPGADPMGKRLRMPWGTASRYHQQWMTVIGVVADARYREIEAARLDLFMSYRQFPTPLKHVVVRTDGDPAALAPSVRAAIRSINPVQLIDDVRPMQEIVDAALQTRRITAEIVAALASTAFVLALLGVHAMMAYRVSLRRREIGIRVAIGATHGQLMRDVLGRGTRLGLIGATLGLIAAAAGAQGLQQLLYGVTTTDPVSFGSAAGLVLAATLLGSYLPARRAARVDPLQALREG